MNKGWLLQEIGRAIGASIKGTFDKQMRPDEGMCPDWLAVLLGWFSWGFFLMALFLGV